MKNSTSILSTFNLLSIITLQSLYETPIILTTSLLFSLIILVSCHKQMGIGYLQQTKTFLLKCSKWLELQVRICACLPGQYYGRTGIVIFFIVVCIVWISVGECLLTNQDRPTKGHACEPGTELAVLSLACFCQCSPCIFNPEFFTNAPADQRAA